MWNPHALAAAAVAAALLVVSNGKGDDRAAPPPDADVEKAQATVRDLFKADFARTKAADRVALGAKLFQQAVDTKDDPAARYVLLREARDLAARAGEPLGVIRAADELGARFALRPGEPILPAVDLLVAGATSTTQGRQTAEVLMLAADEARFAGEFETAQAILKGAATATARTNPPGVLDRLKARLKDTETGKAEAEKVKEATAALSANPNDPAANLAVGRFRAFVLQRWDEGIPLLAKGADEKLQAAAERDLKAATGSTDDQTAAADSWYALAPSVGPVAKPAVQIRALHWYVTAAGSQTGLNRTRLDKRIAELQPVVDARKDKTKMWSTVRRATGDARLNKWRIVGGGFYQKTFEELPPGGGILVGFHYTTSNGGRFPHVVQPIYLTQVGEIKALAYGVPAKGDSPLMTTKARPGYAVGAIYVRGGGGFDAFQPIYMRITDSGVNPSDSYDGPYVGGMGGGEGTLGGDGNFVVGIHGKLGDKGAMGAMSPISLTVNDPVRPKTRPVPKKKNKKP